MAPDRPQPVRNPRRARRSWERPSCHGVSGQVLPRARPRRTVLQAPVPSPALPLRRSFPGLFPALLFSTALLRSGESTFAIYYFFFFAAFLAFLFFAITSLRQRLMKQAQRPSTCGGRFNRRKQPGGESRVAQHTERLKNLFSARIPVPLSRSNNFAQKIFQQHCTY